MRSHEEDTLQIQVFEYLNIMSIFAFHPKNSGKKSIQSAVRDKKLGVKAGVPDIVIIGFDGVTRYIELKTNKGSLNENQKDFKAFCLLNNIPYSLCRSLDDVIIVLKEWHLIKG